MDDRCLLLFDDTTVAVLVVEPAAEGVPAVGEGTLERGPCPGVLWAATTRASVVLASRHGLKVVGVDAPLALTQVINDEVVGQVEAPLERPGHSMGRGEVTAPRDVAVAALKALGSVPRPASVSTPRSVDVGPEALRAAVQVSRRDLEEGHGLEPMARYEALVDDAVSGTAGPATPPESDALVDLSPHLAADRCLTIRRVLLDPVPAEELDLDGRADVVGDVEPPRLQDLRWVQPRVSAHPVQDPLGLYAFSRKEGLGFLARQSSSLTTVLLLRRAQTLCAAGGMGLG